MGLLFPSVSLESDLPSSIDLAIIGAGPQALTLVTHLLQKRAKLRGRFRVFDPSGAWLSRWRSQFAAQEIQHLRSPAVHHPDPHPVALRNFAQATSAEFHPPYDRPGTQLFNDFCTSVVARWQLQDCLIPQAVTELKVESGRSPFVLTTPAGQVRARRVVLATGAGQAHWPDWALRSRLELGLGSELTPAQPHPPIRHASQIDLARLADLTGEHVLIVGGGLSSGHLALGAIRRGARVTLLLRGPAKEKLFDADPGWLGPKYLKGFAQEPDWEKRWQMIKAARNGGSFTPEVLTQLRKLSRDGKVELLEHCAIEQAEPETDLSAHSSRPGWQVRYREDGSGLLRTLVGDRLWLATGQVMDARQHPLLQSVQQAYPTQMVAGLPVLDQHLRWPGLELFVLGGLAALQLGPAARNIHGGRMAAERVVPAIVKPSLALGISDTPPVRSIK
ncbi:MAG: lysine N(6)-hydroxylase/L-ornithine N(5)-oxygenase family protein [Synechococcales cyanobacterium CRU_2_2]|nr:lysine N(6)-hydroxylase/L-ornithine N(5)-oxygenase family protein [Synechococcales cyanobacterium CRU_2_2]